MMPNTLHWFNEVVKRQLPATSRLKLTPALLKAAVPHIPDPVAWAPALDDAFWEFELKDPMVWAMFLGQIGHECMSFTRLEENLNYSAKRLTEVWPRRFPTIRDAKPFARNPPALAEKVYGGRMGNSRSGDGWNYRGRGPIMLTGRENYRIISQGIHEPLVRMPSRLLLPEVGARAACYYWVMRVDDPYSLEQTTFDINGGYNGLQDRGRRVRIALAAFSGLR